MTKLSIVWARIKLVLIIGWILFWMILLFNTTGNDHTTVMIMASVETFIIVIVWNVAKWILAPLFQTLTVVEEDK